MCRDTGADKEPVAPALLAMVVLLHGYQGIPDAKAVEMTVVDLRWQLVIDVLGATGPAFSQGALCALPGAAHLARHGPPTSGAHRRAARRTKELDWNRLPKDLRVAVDSMPLEGAGRVEDTINQLAHAGRKAIVCVSALLNHSAGSVAYSGREPLFAADHSIKRARDTEWSDAEQEGTGSARYRRAGGLSKDASSSICPIRPSSHLCPVTSPRSASSASKVSSPSRILPVAARVSAMG